MRKRLSGPELNDRQLKVLYCISREYVVTGKPVSSKQVLEHSSLEFSSATVRNDMRKLEFLGYIYQPHTSAGRMPTDKGLRFYLDSIKSISQDLKESNVAIATMNAGIIGDIEKLLKGMTRILASTASTLAIIEKPNFEKLIVKHVGISEIAEGYLNVTVITDLGVTSNSTIFLRVGKEDLSSLETMVNRVTTGKTFEEIRSGIKTIELQKDQWYDNRFQELLYFLRNVFEAEIDEKYYTYGFEYLLSNQFLTWEDISGMVKYVENPVNLRNFLSGLGDIQEGKIFIGNEIGKEELKNFTIFVAPYRKMDEKLGIVAVFSPKITYYEKLYGYLHYTANRLSEVFSSR